MYIYIYICIYIYILIVYHIYTYDPPQVKQGQKRVSACEDELEASEKKLGESTAQLKECQERAGEEEEKEEFVFMTLVMNSSLESSSFTWQYSVVSYCHRVEC
jgi:hypothetical protein